MIGRRIGYSVLLIYIGYSVLLYSYRGLRYLFAVLLLLPFAGLIQLLLYRFHYGITSDIYKTACIREEEETVELIFCNYSGIPISRVGVWLEWKSPTGEIVRQREWIDAIGGKEERSLIVNVPTEHCGQAVLHVKRIKIYDYLIICALRVKKPDALMIPILPKRETLDVEGIENIMLSGKILRKGADDLENYEVRTYRPGDNLHLIHWKLSVREEELQIRDYESSRLGGSAVFLELPAEGKQNPDRMDAYLDRAFSLIFALFYGSFG